MPPHHAHDTAAPRLSDQDADTPSRPRYDAYKDSGVDWLGAIPEHWKTAKLKYLCKQSAVYGANRSSDEYINEGVRFLRTTDIDDFGRLSNEGVSISEDSVEDYLLADGDLLLSRSGTVGRSFVYEEDEHPRAAYAGYLVRFVLKKNEMRPNFAFYFTKTTQFNEWLKSNSIESTIGNVSGDKYANMTMVVPPLPEQRAIAAYLDRETERIDALLDKKQRLIDLLEEKRTALISHAVTKGLDDDAEMQDSGVEWLGALPAHWETAKVTHLLESLNRKRIPVSSTERAKMQGEYPYYGASGVIDHVDDYLFEEPLILVAEDGANLFSRSTPLAFVARGRYWVNNHAHILRPRYEPLEYWAYVLRSIIYDPWITGAAQPKLTQDNLGSIRLPVPPESERHEIVKMLSREKKQINGLISRVRDGIARLKEYRTALISAAVTGRIDVRGSA